MKQCPHCGKMCSSRTIVCPGCGYLFSAEMMDDRWATSEWRPPEEQRLPPPAPNGGKPKTPPVAVAAVVFGAAAFVGSWLAVGLLLAIPGFVCGLIGRARIRRSGGRMTGESFASAGIALSLLAGLVGLYMLIQIWLNWPEISRELAGLYPQIVRPFRP